MRSIKVEAFDARGQLLAGVSFKYYFNGKYFGAAEGGHGIAWLHLTEPSPRKLEIEGLFAGEKVKVKVGVDATFVQLRFDPDRKPPLLLDNGIYEDDPHRGRWGGLSESDGRRLTAVLRDHWAEGFKFDLVVEATDGKPLLPPIRFHLHPPTFNKAILDVRKIDAKGQRASLREINANKAFVAAAQVRDADGKWIGLEFDLNTLSRLPQSLKDPKWFGDQRVVDTKANEEPTPMPPKDPHLEPKDQGYLANLLDNAFSRVHVEGLLLELNRRPDKIIPDRSRSDQACRAVVDEANRELWWKELVLFMRRARPTHPQIIAFASRFDLTLPVYDMSSGHAVQWLERDLEAKVAPEIPSFDIAIFRERLAEVEAQVCRIERPGGTALGTGFLVGPDVVLTNYHVLRAIIDETNDQLRRTRASQVVLRFDYKVMADGVSIGAGKPVKLHSDWLIDWSPYSPHDIELEPSGEPSSEHLDYALLRLETPIGRLPVLEQVPDAPKRNWIRLVPFGNAPDLEKQKALFIVQHPEGQPMKLAIDMKSILGKLNDTRLRYRTNTERGSSGSPCFSADWTCVALHHSGDPKYSDVFPARYNQGILIPPIIELLQKRGKLALLPEK